MSTTTATRTTGKAIKLYRGGVHGLVEYAVREDGALFSRFQDRGPYGYRWGAWRASGRMDPNSLPPCIESGFSTLYPSDPTYRPFAKLRLPMTPLENCGGVRS